MTSNDNLVTVYHYSDIGAWPDIENGSTYGRGKPGLTPIKRVGNFYDGAIRTTATWALLSPQPLEWTDNKNFREAWGTLKFSTGRLLLEVSVDLDNPNVFVADWAHMESSIRSLANELGIHTPPKRYVHGSKKVAEIHYWSGRKKLGDYLERKDELNFSLPEVIITEDTPIDKVKVSSNQWRLREILGGNFHGWPRQSMLHQMKVVPGLLEMFPEKDELISDWRPPTYAC